MGTNPFLNVSRLDLPLQRDLCEQIHFTALRAAVREHAPSPVPARVPVDALAQQARRYGTVVLFPHPEETAKAFAGVTFLVYQAIDSLYCTRVGRSIEMVWHILSAMADSAGVPPIEYEAVWSICVWLDKRRTIKAGITTEQVETTWRLFPLTPAITIQDSRKAYFRPSILCVLDELSQRILAFRVTKDQDQADSASLVIYDAIVSQRSPAQQAAGGLIWHMPAILAAETELPDSCQEGCRQVGINVETSSGTTPLVDNLRGNWVQDFGARALEVRRFAACFDTYLEKVHGNGPLHQKEKRDKEFRALLGYNQDPALLYPQLRNFIPLRTAVIDAGAVEYDGLHYQDVFLSYWPGHLVSVRRSEHAEARAWVYLDGQILCEAMAQELRRKDGTYRPNRPGR